jgi:hypothetical protein
MQPRVFVASSFEGLPIAHAIQSNLAQSVEVVVWDQSVFEPSLYVLETLQRVLQSFDFGIFVFSGDDALHLRGEQHTAVRDNVVFELGLFISTLGKERTFIVAPAGEPDQRIPSDLLGITRLNYNPRWSNLQASLNPACTAILTQVRARGAYYGGALRVHLINQKSGNALEVGDWKRDDGAAIQQWRYHGGDNQVWVLRRVEQAVFSVVSLHSGKCIVPRGSLIDNEPLVQAEYSGGRHQQWLFRKLEDGSFTLTVLHNGFNLSMLDGSCEDGTPAVQHHWPGFRQRWRVQLAQV